MRITNNMLIRNMMSNLNNNLRRMDKVQQQFSSGKKFQLPSDDPIGVSKSLKLHTDISKIEQYKRNLDDAVSWLEITEDSLAQIGDVLHRASELSVQAASGTYSDVDLKQISAEIGQLRDHLVQISNTTYAGRSIFSGFKTDAPLLDEEGNYKLTNYGFGAGTFDTNILKSNEISKYNVGVAEDVAINTVGIRVFGVFDGSLNNTNFDASSVKGYNIDTNSKTSELGTGTNKSYLIGIFDNLKNAMDTDDRSTIGDIKGNLDKVMENTLSVRGEIGAKMNRLELTKNRLESETINFTQLLSDNEDADMAKVIMDLKIEENVYRASLSAGAKVIQPTLIDFLR